MGMGSARTGWAAALLLLAVLVGGCVVYPDYAAPPAGVAVAPYGYYYPRYYGWPYHGYYGYYGYYGWGRSHGHWGGPRGYYGHGHRRW